MVKHARYALQHPSRYRAYRQNPSRLTTDIPPHSKPKKEGYINSNLRSKIRNGLTLWNQVRTTVWVEAKLFLVSSCDQFEQGTKYVIVPEGRHFCSCINRMKTVVPMALRFSMTFSSTKLPPLSGLSRKSIPFAQRCITYSGFSLRRVSNWWHAPRILLN